MGGLFQCSRVKLCLISVAVKSNSNFPRIDFIFSTFFLRRYSSIAIRTADDLPLSFIFFMSRASFRHRKHPSSDPPPEALRRAGALRRVDRIAWKLFLVLSFSEYLCSSVAYISALSAHSAVQCHLNCLVNFVMI